jgi:D-threo-aldose 1-dehydrogenase
MKTRDFKAPSGATIPFTEMGMGSAPLGNLYRAVNEQQAQATLDAAWNAGIRYYDTAPLYGFGLAETRLNQFLRGKKREDYVISTKIGRALDVVPPELRSGIGKFFDVPNRRERWDYSYDGVLRSLEFSLARLGLDYVDMLLVHDVDIFSQGSREMRDQRVEELMASGYKALLRLRDEGVIKAFGAGVNEWEVCQWLTERGDFDVFLLAGRYTLLEQKALDSFLPICEQRGIGIILGGPYNSGILATGPKPGAFYNYDPAPQEILERVARIENICAKHGVALVEAALRFPLHHKAVVTVLPGGQSASEVERNVATLTATIPPALWADLKAEGLLHAQAPVPT